MGALGWEPHGSSLKANKIFGAPLKPSELFSSKDTKNFAALLFCLAACNKKFQRANAQISRRMKMIHRLLVEEGMSTGHGSWILWSVSRVRSKTMHSLSCITIWLFYITLCYIDSSFFRPLEQSRTALLAAASQPRVFARLLVGNYELKSPTSVFSPIKSILFSFDASVIVKAGLKSLSNVYLVRGWQIVPRKTWAS